MAWHSHWESPSGCIAVISQCLIERADGLLFTVINSQELRVSKLKDGRKRE